MTRQVSPFCWNFIAATQNQYSVVCMAPHACMYAWQCQGMLLMRRQMVSWGISSQIWTMASLSSWTVWIASWQCQMDLNIMSQRCSSGFRQASACTLLPHKALLCTGRNQNHYTIIGSDSGSNFIPITNNSQGTVVTQLYFCKGKTVRKDEEGKNVSGLYM